MTTAHIRRRLWMTKRVLALASLAAAGMAVEGVRLYMNPQPGQPMWFPAAAVMTTVAWVAFVSVRGWALRQWRRADLAEATAWLERLHASWTPQGEASNDTRVADQVAAAAAERTPVAA